MNWLAPVVLTTTTALLLGLGLAPCSGARGAARLRGGWTTLLSGMALLASLATAVVVMTTEPIDIAWIRFDGLLPFCLGAYIDALTAVMTTLISFIGLIIARYSQRYLQGDPHQSRFFRWMSFTLGATLLLVMSCNLVMFTAAWMLTSFGLHQLLTHYPERSWAIWAARKKFLISRLGDAMLITALALTYRTFGTTEYSTLFAAIDGGHQGPAAASGVTAAIGILFVLGAMTKSAQFPFHSWLPDTMETPTPVSALMHAGVINAGGFLVIRLSPLISLSPLALDLLALAGAFTAILASVVMLTQTSVKRSLAYSTIAQMGFMMLQCGLGAFSAALLHIVAHSAYKAHAFLSCGSVLDAARKLKAPSMPPASTKRSLIAFVVALALGAALVIGTLRTVGIDIVTKPGGAVLGLILTLAIVQVLWKGLATGVRGLGLRSLASAVAIAALYAVGYRVMDHLLAGSTSHHEVAASPLDIVVLALVALGFAGVFALQALAEQFAEYRWFRALYVHAMNGFYIDIPARRLTAMFYRQSAPVQ